MLVYMQECICVSGRMHCIGFEDYVVLVYMLKCIDVSARMHWWCELELECVCVYARMHWCEC